MIYLIDQLPNFCPSCGKQHTDSAKDQMADDFFAGASGQCNCGAKYQYVPEAVIVEASKLNECGDLHRYA